MTIGERIKKIREEKGMSVDKLAELIGKNRATIYRYESNDIEKLPTSVLESLCKALGTTPIYIMGWEDENNTSKESSDVDIRRIEQARSKMSDSEKDKMMKILEASFDEYFSDNFIDEDTDE